MEENCPSSTANPPRLRNGWRHGLIWNLGCTTRFRCSGHWLTRAFGIIALVKLNISYNNYYYIFLIFPVLVSSRRSKIWKIYAWTCSGHLKKQTSSSGRIHVHVYGFTCSNPPNKSINRYKFIWRPLKIPNYFSEKPKTVGKENQILCNPDIITPKIFLAALLVVLDDTSERDGMGLWCWNSWIQMERKLTRATLEKVNDVIYEHGNRA